MNQFTRPACFILLFVQAVSTQVKAAPIPVVSATKESDGVLLKMNPGTLKLQVCSDRIIRVTYSPTDKMPVMKSFVVTAVWPKTRFKVDDNEKWVGVRTHDVVARVDRATGAVSFLDNQGNVVLAEPADGGKTMTPVRVNQEDTYQPEQTFVSPADEYLYGLGQFQDGFWNWRGVPRQLREVNTQITSPMLVSGRGYGLLWDNASLTDFNPPGQEVAINRTNHMGTFTTGAAGDYVFYVRSDNYRDRFRLLIDGQVAAHSTNSPMSSFNSLRVSLPANTTCELLVAGGNAKVLVGPVADTSTFRSQVGDAIDYYFFYGPEPDSVIAGYRQATGQAPLFPEWALGFWQCRERYSSQQQILDAAEQFRQREIPVDVIVQDWKYWGKYGWSAFKFDEDYYPDPAAMIRRLHDLHFAYMISVWSKNAGDENKELRAANGLMPRGKAGEEWFDAFDPVAGAIRWKYMKRTFFDIGTDAWWMDATEPETELLENFQVPGGSVNRFVNAYPLFANKSVYEGQRAASDDKRVCILSRSAFAGQQRYAAACWSGDINGTWDTLRRQIPAGLNFCMAGLPYWTTDIGGFIRPGNQYHSLDYQELLTRWFEFGAFCPIFRIHGGNTETEMWKWPPAVEAVERRYDELRHRLVPYLYSDAWQVTSQGGTMMRALVMDFRNDPNALAISDQFMFGPAFLVTPVTQRGATNRAVYLPAGTDWFDFWTGEKFSGGQTVMAAAPVDTIPLFVREGSIVPMGPSIQYVGEKPEDPIELRVYRGADGAFTLYEDGGNNYSYEKGAYATIPIQWDDKTQTLTIGKRKGRFPGMLRDRVFRVVYVSAGNGTGIEPTEKPDEEVHYTGSKVVVSLPPI